MPKSVTKEEEVDIRLCFNRDMIHIYIYIYIYIYKHTWYLSASEGSPAGLVAIRVKV